MLTGQRHKLTDPEILELKKNIRFNLDNLGRVSYNLAIRYRHSFIFGNHFIIERGDVLRFNDVTRCQR